MTRSAAIAVLLGAAAAAPAAEAVVRDLGVVVEARPAAFDFTWSDAQGGRSGSDAFASSWAAGVAFDWGFGSAGSPWTVALGAQAFVQQDEMPGLVRQAAALRMNRSLAWAATNRLTLFARPWLGGSWARATLADAGPAPRTLDGWGWEASAGATLRWAVTPRWAASVNGGWLWSRQRLRDGDAELELRQSGPWVGLGLAWVIDPRSRRLE
jgi:hypothetical protein